MEDTVPQVEAHVVVSSKSGRSMALQTEIGEKTPEARRGFPEVMAAIAACQAALTTKIEVMQMDVGLI